MSIYKSWVELERPVFSRLPQVGYRYTDRESEQEGNNPTDWLTRFPDQELTALLKEVSKFKSETMDAENCDPKYLDMLAVLAGFTGDYWDRGWAAETKRKLITAAFTLLWPQKGSKACLEYVFSAFNLLAEVEEEGAFIVGSNEVGDLIGKNPFRYKVWMPFRYRNRRPQRQIEFLLRLYAPAYCLAEFHYDDVRFRDALLLQVGENQVLSPDPELFEVFRLN